MRALQVPSDAIAVAMLDNFPKPKWPGGDPGTAYANMYLPERGQIDPEALMRADKAHGELPPHPVLDVRTLSYATECGATVDVFDARGGALASANVQGPALMHEAKVTVFGKPNILRVLTMHPPPPPNSA